MDLFSFEIKLTKTPKPAMAGNLVRFKDLFPKLNIKSGKILSLAEENFQFTKDVGIQNLDGYLEALGKSI